MKNYEQPGDVLPFVAPAGGVVSGNAYKIDQAFVVATETAAAGATFSGKIVGVCALAKVSAQAWTVGQQIAWDDTAKLCTTVTLGNFRIGFATAIAANPTATGSVRLNGIGVGAALA